jgi:UDP-N-acetylglucosamine 2-epimerase
MSKQRVGKVMVLVGTRPEAVKMAPVVMALRGRKGLECVLVSTGQHREMLAQALAVFGLVPDGAVRTRPTHGSS